MDDEIIIGINKKNNSNKKNSNKNAKKRKNNENNNKVKKNTSKKNEVRTSSNIKKIQRRRKIKICAIVFVFILLIILICSSSLFNIKNIVVEGNEKLSDDKIISLSSLELYTNIFSFNKSSVIENIKENAYIRDVQITRSLPSTVKITVEERTPKYMLQFADSYVYINNQGYMLEISNEKLNLPILIGLTTDLSNIKAGNRINVEDLKKMEMVIKIYETAKSNDLGDLITKIDISNEKNYTIILETEGKTVYLGDCSDLNTRILYLKSILEASEGKNGEIFLNIDLNSQNPYFRPSSN